MVDEYDTSQCPPLSPYAKCVGCAEQDRGMELWAIGTRYGVACLPVCPLCVDTIEMTLIPDPADVWAHARHQGREEVTSQDLRAFPSEAERPSYEG